MAPSPMALAVCNLIEQFLAERREHQSDMALPACDVTVRVEPADDDSLDHDMELIVETAALKMVSVVLLFRPCYRCIDCGNYVTKIPEKCSDLYHSFFFIANKFSSQKSLLNI